MAAVSHPGSAHPHATDGTLGLAGGRTIAYRTYGDPAGSPIIALHGTPGSRLKFSSIDEIARRRGQRIIAPDRWGYGGTSVHPSPSLTAFAGDIIALADKLDVKRFALLAVSGGGPYACAVAALHPQRIAALALSAPVGPLAGEHFDMSAFHRFCFGPLARRPAAVRAVFHGLRGLLRISPRLGVAAATATVPRTDRRVLDADGAGVRKRLSATFSEGLSLGVHGPAIDLGLFCKPWNVDLARADVPARLWLGDADRNVPLAAARLLAQRLPRCELTPVEGGGHLWVALNYDKLLDWIAQQHGPT